MPSSSSALPSASHFLSVFALALIGFDFLRNSSSPEEAVAEIAARLARLETPTLPVNFADSKWPGSGVVGLEFSGVGIGVISVEVPPLCGTTCGPDHKVLMLALLVVL